MSRNYELLQSAERERGIPAISLPETKAKPSGPRLVLSLAALAEIQKLVDRLFLSAGASSPRSVVFASTEEIEWGGWLCAHTADVLAARVPGQVCVVDADLRSPSLHLHFSRDDPHGLSELIRNPNRSLLDIATPINDSNLSLLAAGFAENHDSDLLRSANLLSRIEELRNQFDYVLIAAPAIPRSVDALALARLTDGIVLVIQTGSARREAIRELTNQLVQSGAEVLGVVLTKCASPTGCIPGTRQTSSILS
jgi:capsular exopolysaccharide synthesis family protein